MLPYARPQKLLRAPFQYMEKARRGTIDLGKLRLAFCGSYFYQAIVRFSRLNDLEFLGQCVTIELT